VLAFASLALFVFTIPWEKTIYFPDLGTLSRFVGLAAFGLGALALFRGNGISVRPLPLYLLTAVLLILWMIATLMWTADRDASIAYLVTLTQLVAMSWLVWQQAKGEGRRRALLQAYVLG